jgi:gliding motility-associated-like protein
MQKNSGKDQNFLLICSSVGGGKPPNQTSFEKNTNHMKKLYATLTRIPTQFAFVFLLFFGFQQTAKACHALPVLNLVATVNPTDLTINANSDPATCGCGQYYIEVELSCTSNGFTGLAPAYNSSTWGTNPWFHSTLTVGSGLDQCILEAYNPLVIPFNQLCSGTTYFWRIREYVVNGTNTNIWSGPFSFTTPGPPPATNMTASANAYQGCPGDTLQLNAVVTGGCPGGTLVYSWAPTVGLSNPNIANPTLIIQNSNVTYTCTASGGCVTITSSDDTVAVQVGPPPIAGAVLSNPTTICSGGNSWLSLTGQDPNSTLQWQISTNGVTWFNIAGATSDSLNTGAISTSLYYQVIVSGSGWPGSGCGSSTSNSVQVIVSPAPAANAGPNITICPGACVTLNGTGGNAQNWQPGNFNTASINVCPTSQTTYTLTVTDINGCTGTDLVTVGISAPSCTASPDVSICIGNSTVLVASGPNGNTYSWSPAGSLTGANTANPTSTPTVTTTYTVTSTNILGCTAMDSVTVTVTIAPPIVASADTSMCAGATANLTATGATSYLWQPGNLTGANVAVNPIITTTYVITGTTNNCSSTDTVVVNVTPPPFVFAGPDFSICYGEQGTLNAATNGTSYLWTPTGTIIGSNTQQSVVINPTVNTSYTVLVIGPGGCFTTDTINVVVNTPPTVTANTTDNSICIGSTTNVNASGAVAYSWIPTIGVQNPNQASTNATPPTTTTYQVIGIDANGCSDTASVTITINPNPYVSMATTASECGDSTGTISFGAIGSGTGPFTYTINNQTTTLPVTGLTAGNYTIVTTDANGCTSSEVISIAQVNTAFVNATASPNFGVYPLSTTFTTSNSNGMNNWVWSYGDGGPLGSGSSTSYLYNTPGVYTVIVAAWNDNPSCVVYDTILVEVVEQAIITLPNVMTPNEDNNNDFFSASVSGVKEMNVEIFDRWGKVIYSGSISAISSAPQVVDLWNGKSKGGNYVADGVYYYIVNAEGYDGNMYPFKGFIQLSKGL